MPPHPQPGVLTLPESSKTSDHFICFLHSNVWQPLNPVERHDIGQSGLLKLMVVGLPDGVYNMARTGNIFNKRRKIERKW
jgi:hypothetical protein